MKHNVEAHLLPWDNFAPEMAAGGSTAETQTVAFNLVAQILGLTWDYIRSKAAQTIYNIVMFFVNRGSQVVELVQAITESISAIASGALGQAASLVESALAKALPVAIGFLALLIGVSGLARKVQNVVEGIHKRVDDAIEFVLKKAKQMAASLLRRLGIGRGEEGEEEEDKVEIPDGPVGESVTFNTPDEGHRLWIELKSGEPVVMVASTPEQAQTKLDNIASQIQGIQNIPPHLLAKARELLTRGYRLLNVTEDQIDQRLNAQFQPC